MTDRLRPQEREAGSAITNFGTLCSMAGCGVIAGIVLDTLRAIYGSEDGVGAVGGESD